jgi:hypothetical protein
MDLLNPEYNLNSTAGSRLGANITEESRVKMRAAAQGRKHTEDTKNLISLANKGINNPRCFFEKKLPLVMILKL